MQDAFDMYKLASEGFCCSQILIMMELKKRGCENKELVKSMTGLCGGIGGSGKTCGIISGGACVFGFYAGTADSTHIKDDNLNKMIIEYIEWFENEYGSCDCEDIIQVDNLEEITYNNKYPVKCGNLMTQSYKKVKSILKEYGYIGD